MDGFKAPKTLHPAAVGHMSIENDRGCLAFFDIFGGSLIGAKWIRNEHFHRGWPKWVIQLFSLFSGKEVGPDLRWAFRKHCSDHCNIESAYWFCGLINWLSFRFGFWASQWFSGSSALWFDGLMIGSGVFPLVSHKSMAKFVTRN